MSVFKVVVTVVKIEETLITLTLDLKPEAKTMMQRLGQSADMSL